MFWKRVASKSLYFTGRKCLRRAIFKGRLLLLLAVVLVVVVLVVVVLGSGSGCFGCGSGCLRCLWVVVVVVVALLVVIAPCLLQPEKLKQLKVESPGSLNP